MLVLLHQISLNLNRLQLLPAAQAPDNSVWYSQGPGPQGKDEGRGSPGMQLDPGTWTLRQRRVLGPREGSCSSELLQTPATTRASQHLRGASQGRKSTSTCRNGLPGSSPLPRLLRPSRPSSNLAQSSLTPAPTPAPAPHLGSVQPGRPQPCPLHTGPPSTKGLGTPVPAPSFGLYPNPV